MTSERDKRFNDAYLHDASHLLRLILNWWIHYQKHLVICHVFGQYDRLQIKSNEKLNIEQNVKLRRFKMYACIILP